MDIATVLGVVLVVGGVVVGVSTGELPAIFLNWHGLLIVFGGTLASLLINTPMRLLLEAAGALKMLFAPPKANLESTALAVTRLAEQVRSRGFNALSQVDKAVDGEFVADAARLAVECNNPEFFEQIVEEKIRTTFDHQNEIVNVYRTIGVLSPMFGLIGTLIGIVQVLRLIATPDKVGPAMAVALTTAFYGIALANLVCVPIAGKLRLRYWEELRAHSVAGEGVALILKGTVPALIDRKLKAYADKTR